MNVFRCRDTKAPPHISNCLARHVQLLHDLPIGCVWIGDQPSSNLLGLFLSCIERLVAATARASFAPAPQCVNNVWRQRNGTEARIGFRIVLDFPIVTSSTVSFFSSHPILG